MYALPVTTVLKHNKRLQPFAMLRKLRKLSL